MSVGLRRAVPAGVAVLLVAVFQLGVVSGPPAGAVEGVAVLGSVALVPAVALARGPWRSHLRWLFAAGVAVGVVSIATGLGNNTTDEPFTMGGYLATLLHGRDPYTTATTFHLDARTWGIAPHPHTVQYLYVYLPGLLFFQVPGTGAVGYKAMCLAAWAGIVYLVRDDRPAALCLVSPTVALLSANGFTDLPALLLLTFALRGPPGAARTAAEAASYAMKQFANVFWIGLHLLRRDLLRVALAVALTLAFCTPFLLWHPTGVWCEALTFGLGPGCAGTPGASGRFSEVWTHWNYYLWPLWVLALYHREALAFGRRLLARLRSRGGAEPASG